MKGLIIPSLMILGTGIFVGVAYADSDRDATTVQCNPVLQISKISKNQGCADNN